MSDGRGRFLTVQPESRRLLSPLTPTKKISVWKTKIVGFFCWGSQMRQVQVQGGWAHSLVGEGTVFLGGFFFESTQKLSQRICLAVTWEPPIKFGGEL